MNRRDMTQHIEAGWCMYASVNWVIIGSDNGLLPVWCQAIIWINADNSSIRPEGTYFNEVLFEIQKFLIQENAFESVIWRPQC